MSKLVVYLLKSVIALKVTPIDEYSSVVDTGAILAPAFKSHMGLGQGSYGRSMPSEIALGPVCAKDDGRAAIALSVTTGFVLSCIPDIEHADGPNEVELWSADIDVCAILNEPECLVGRNEIFYWQGLERSTAVRLIQGFKDAASVVL